MVNSKNTLNKVLGGSNIKRVQVASSSAGPSRVRDMVEQVEQMTPFVAKKNTVGNRKKAEMDIENYLGSLTMQGITPRPPPASPNMYDMTGAHVESTSTISVVSTYTITSLVLPSVATLRQRQPYRTRVNYIKRNKLLLTLQQLEVSKRKMENMAKQISAKPFSNVPSRYMSDYNKIVERNTINNVLKSRNNMTDVLSSLSGVKSRRHARKRQTLSTKLAGRKRTVPSKYMNCFMEIKRKALQKKYRQIKQKPKKLISKNVKPFYYKNSVQLSRMKAMNEKRNHPVKTQRWNNSNGIVETKGNIKYPIRKQGNKKLQKISKARLLKKKSKKQDVKKQQYSGSYNKEWKRRYHVTEWLQARSAHLYHQGDVKQANILQKNLRPIEKQKTVNQTLPKMKKNRENFTRAVKKPNTITVNKTLPRTNLKMTKDTTQKNMNRTNIKKTQKKFQPIQTRKPPVNKLKKNSAAGRSVHKKVKPQKGTKKHSMKENTKRKKLAKGKRKLIKGLSSFYYNLASEDSGEDYSHLYRSQQLESKSESSRLTVFQPEIRDVNHFNAELTPSTSRDIQSSSCSST